MSARETQAGLGRLHGLDAVRGYALMLGIVYHATMSYLPGPQIWPVIDTHRSVLLSGLFFVSHIFRMSTFFLIAGFFGHMVVEKRGVKAFVKDRAKRIALPLVVGWPILFAAIVGATIYGAYVSSGHMPTMAEHAAVAAKGPPSPPLAFPLTHLWFLYLLLWLYAATLGLRALVLKLDKAGRIRARADAVLAAIVESRFAPARARCSRPRWPSCSAASGWSGLASRRRTTRCCPTSRPWSPISPPSGSAGCSTARAD